MGIGVVRSSLLISLHEGTFWFGNWGRYIIALPMALSLLFLSISGIVLYFQPALFKRSLQNKKRVNL
ncbi:MAG: PepSY domain-containing protein [Bdellovibrionaceae bacterium]|nr:PepSY domain-containing protein [Pseudobdellovibrionaceae bacterium]